MRVSPNSLLLLLCASHSGYGRRDGKKREDNIDGVNTGGDTFAYCQVEDRNGGALEDALFAPGGASLVPGVLCVYPGTGECVYFVSNGSLSSGGTSCPQALLVQTTLVPPTSPTQSGQASSSSLSGTSVSMSTSSSLSMSASSSLASYSQTKTIPQRTGGTPADSSTTVTGTARTLKLPPGMVAGIVVVVIIFLACLAAMLFWHTRRRRHVEEQPEMGMSLAVPQMNHVATTISPFALIAAVSNPNCGNDTEGEDSPLRTVGITTSSIAQQGPEMQPISAGEKRVDWETVEDTTAGPSVRRTWGQLSTQSPPTTSQPDVEAQLQAARDHISVLMRRITQMETNSSLAWERVIGEEPLPEYAREESRQQ